MYQHTKSSDSHDVTSVRLVLWQHCVLLQEAGVCLGSDVKYTLTVWQLLTSVLIVACCIYLCKRRKQRWFFVFCCIYVDCRSMSMTMSMSKVDLYSAFL